MPREIRADEAARYVLTRRDLWEAMHRDGWFLPRLVPAVTIAYMQAVRRRSVWCPRYDDVRLRPCLVPPPTKQLLTWIAEALQLQRQGVHHGRRQGNRLQDRLAVQRVPEQDRCLKVCTAASATLWLSMDGCVHDLVVAIQCVKIAVQMQL